MVHALAECRRVLRTAGLLIDLRPFAGNWPLEVVAPSASPTRSTPGAWAVGRVDDSQERPDDQAANAAIAHAVRAGWFRAERTTTFEYAWYWDTLAELEAYIAERWATVLRLPPPTQTAARQRLARVGGGARLRLRRGMILGRYRRGD
jgi:hypothetical protein